MIIGAQKPLEEIFKMLEGQERILVAGCRSCVAVCHAGGEREVAILAEALRLRAALESKPWTVEEVTVERQCEGEWVSAMAPLLEGKDAVLSLACGVGAQTVQAMYPRVRCLPGLNTSNMGAPDEPGVFVEKCGGCGDCVLHVLSPDAPRACSTGPAVARRTVNARYHRTCPAPGTRSCAAWMPWDELTCWKSPSHRRAGCHRGAEVRAGSWCPRPR
jgi:ferredoxin